jgi:hypothetical protein
MMSAGAAVTDKRCGRCAYEDGLVGSDGASADDERDVGEEWIVHHGPHVGLQPSTRSALLLCFVAVLHGAA